MDTDITSQTPTPLRRNFALDVFRGLGVVLMLLVPLVEAAHRGGVLPDGVTRLFGHSWGGLTFWGVLLPWFVFACGVSVALTKARMTARSVHCIDVCKRVLLRVVLLWVGGLILDGALLSFDPAGMSFFNSPLQTIAVAYLVGWIVSAIRVRFVRAVIPVLLLVGYAGALRFMGDYTEYGNFAWTIEHSVLGGTPETHDASAPLWVFTTVPYAAIALVGVQGGELLNGNWSKAKKSGSLAILGVLLLGIGLALTLFVPSLIQICTVSFAAQALGCCLLILSMCALVPGVGASRYAMSWCAFLGRVSFIAYVVGGFCRPMIQQGATILVQKFADQLGENVLPLVVEGVATLILLAVLLLRLSRKSDIDYAVHSSVDPDPNGGPKSDNGAVAPRFRIPGMEGKVSTSARSDRPARSTRTCLKLHRESATGQGEG